MTVESWTVFGYLCDGVDGDNQCNAITDSADDMRVVKIMAEEDGWVIDGELTYCPKHRGQVNR